MSEEENTKNNACRLSIKPAPPSLGLAPRDGMVARPPEAFALKKRRIKEEEEQPGSSEATKLNMSSYNSAFLVGLFEDVKHVVTVQAGESEVPKTNENTEKEKYDTPSKSTLGNLQLSPSVKRRRVSNVKSLTDFHQEEEMCRSSTMSFLDSMDTPNAFQPTRSKSLYMDLPATVSESFTSQHELAAVRKIFSFALLPTDHPNANGKDDDQGDFGWYVDMDQKDDDDDENGAFQPVDPYTTTNDTTYQLAFSASTAPKQTRYSDKAELEYALAADTVDDVLGDFF